MKYEIEIHDDEEWIINTEENVIALIIDKEVREIIEFYNGLKIKLLELVCDCPNDWTDGTGTCQECGLKRP